MPSMISFATRLLAVMLCAASMSAVSQSSLQDEQTRRTQRLPESPGADIPDEVIEAAVTLELQHDPLIDTDTIEVAAAGPVITLTGTQPLLIARDRATYIAETVRGVRQVVNEITVDADREVDAERLESDIIYALLTDPATERAEFTVESGDTGNVVLRGTVDSGAERSIAEKIVKSIAGVRSVINEVEVQRSVRRSDEEIYADVQRMLQWDAYVDSAEIEVGVQDGVVTLDGTVDTAAEKRRAAGLSWVAGVTHVNVAPLAVSGEPNRASQALLDAPPPGVPLELRSDEAIAEAVRRGLALDPRLSVESIEVDVDDGVVTLEGKVNTLRAKRIAARTPYGILGVTKVRDRLDLPELQLYEDSEVRRRVQRVLAKNSVLEDDAIIVLARDGVVTLQGTADSRYASALAEDLAAGVRGVAQVQNDIDVDASAERFTYDPYVDMDSAMGYVLEEDELDEAIIAGANADANDDGTIEESVLRELAWSPFVDATDVFLSVENAVVTLKGSVDNEAERRAAVQNAFEGGAVSVKNELVVDE